MPSQPFLKLALGRLLPSSPNLRLREHPTQGLPPRKLCDMPGTHARRQPRIRPSAARRCWNLLEIHFHRFVVNDSGLKNVKTDASVKRFILGIESDLDALNSVCG